MGARVAIVEGDRVGGTCVIRGCVPKKLLVYGAQARHQLADAPAYGLKLGSIQSDVPELLRRVRSEVDRLNTLHLGFLEKAGVNADLWVGAVHWTPQHWCIATAWRSN
jgi:glutathione reductase (NADPH)